MDEFLGMILEAKFSHGAVVLVHGNNIKRFGRFLLPNQRDYLNQSNSNLR